MDSLTPSQLDPAFPEAAPIQVANFSWQGWQPALQATLCFVLDESTQRLLLMRKKRGLGKGKINAPGGKRDAGETLVECACRETLEELHVEALKPQHRGTLWFQFTDGLAMEVAVFLAKDWQGEAQETDEGKPIWFPLAEIPYEEMWADDRHWLPEMLEGRSFHARFLFENELILKAEIEYAASMESFPPLSSQWD